MRNKKRIKRMMDKLTDLWLKVPDWRFYQFLINLGLMPDDNKFWHLNDDKIEKFIDEQKVIK